MWKYIKKYKLLFFISLLALLLVDFSQLLIPRIIGQIYDTLGEEGSFRFFLISGLKIAGLGLSVFAFRFFWRIFLIRMSRKVERDIRENLFYRLLTFSQHFFGKWNTGDLMARAINDINHIQRMFSFGIVSIFDAVVMGLMTLGFMLSYDVKFTLIAVSPLSLLTFVVLYFEKRIHRLSLLVQNRFSRLSTFVQEDFSGNFVLKSLNREEEEKNRFASVSRDYLDKNVRLGRIQALLHASITFIIAISNVLVIYVGGKNVINGITSKGDLIAFLSYLNMMVWPMIAIGFAINIHQRGRASLERVEELTGYKPVITDPPNPFLPEKKPETLSVEVRDLTFSFGEGAPILENVSLSIAPGETVGLIGRIGSGKSTLVKLLSRLLKTGDDTIFFNGVDINRYKLNDLRALISYVPQEPFLFSTTIRENVAYYDTSLDDEAVMEALRKADLSGTIEEMPAGLDTSLGERGVNLSGGQKQRMTIARAILKDAPFFIFDDSFSSIDTDTEERILTSLAPLFENKSVLIIAHRISTLRYADRIVVLDEGRIVEEGTHQELLEARGAYYDIFNRQKLEEKLGRE
ncbi:ABC transporter ATP-binding protein [Candidatus Mcinerneyibacteriota bacterium]|nr:ABC transporter ATP-binding protein [Candidatus Mcinerneyibacteriota bacterium]